MNTNELADIRFWRFFIFGIAFHFVLADELWYTVSDVGITNYTYFSIGYGVYGDIKDLKIIMGPLKIVIGFNK